MQPLVRAFKPVLQQGVAASAAASLSQHRSAVAAPQRAGHQFKVLTYNLLADKYALGGHHGYCLREHLEWPSRRAHIIEELTAYDADIVCLQEVEDRVFSQELQPWFAARGLQGWYMARQKGEVNGPPEGVALFVRTSHFTPLATRSSSFKDWTPDLPPGVGASGEAWEVFRAREEGVVMALLEHTPSQCRLVAACTHLFWHPKYPDVKALQATALCHALRTFASEAAVHSDSPAAAAGSTSTGRAPSVPMLLGGDFNSLAVKYKPDAFDRDVPVDVGLKSGVYTLLSTGSLPSTHPDHPAARRRATDLTLPGAGPWAHATLDDCGLGLRSAAVMAHGQEPILTTKTASFAGCLDYIWLSRGAFSVDESLDLPYQQPASWTDPMTDVDVPPMPNAVQPSDHLPQGFVVTFMGNGQENVEKQATPQRKGGRKRKARAPSSSSSDSEEEAGPSSRYR